LFPEVAKYAKDCRYADCRHVVEEGCAVIRAYESGALDPKVYSSYLKLVKEQQHFEIRVEDKKRLGKQFGKMVREVKAFKDKYK
jgi:ribosome biogenesis GTPase